jgi:hypothetical protein
MASRRGKSAKPRDSRRGQGPTPAVPYYLGTFDSPLSAETRGDVRKSQRPEGPALVEGHQQAMLRQMAEAERQLPELLEKIRFCALASDPLMLFSRLHTFDAMLRSVLPSPAMFGSDALLEFYGGLVTAMPVEQVLTRLGTDDDPQAFYNLHAAVRDYALAEHAVGLGGLDRALIEGSTNALASAQRQLEFEHRFDRMFGFPTQLRPIFDAIIEPIADQAREQIGFAPSNALVVADAYVTVLAKRMREVLTKFDRVMCDSRAPGDRAKISPSTSLASLPPVLHPWRTTYLVSSRNRLAFLATNLTSWSWRCPRPSGANPICKSSVAPIHYVPGPLLRFQMATTFGRDQ